MNKVFDFFRNKELWKHIGAIFFSIAGLMLLVYFALSIYTDHGSYIKVPNVAELTYKDALKALEAQGLRCQISDSTFVRDKPLGAVIAQNPEANSKVKDGRNIYLTVNVSTPPAVKVPQAMEFASLRYARELLEGIGLKAAEKLEYISDPAKDVVLGLKVNGKKIEPGAEVPFGTEITLEVGNGRGSAASYLDDEGGYGDLEGQSVPVPVLIGLSYRQAKQQLITSLLKEGTVIPKTDVIDMENARVYKQVPAGDGVQTLVVGSSVDLYLEQ